LPYLVFYYRPAYFQHGFLAVLVLASGGVLWLSAAVQQRLPPGTVRRLVMAGAAVAVLALWVATWPARMTTLAGLGQTGEEQTAAFLAANYSRETRVMSFSGAVPWMAKMHSPLDWQRLFLLSKQEPTPEQAARHLRETDIELVYLDHMLLKTAPALYEAIRQRVGQEYEPVFRTDAEGAAYRVYRLRPVSEGSGSCSRSGGAATSKVLSCAVIMP